MRAPLQRILLLLRTLAVTVLAFLLAKVAFMQTMRQAHPHSPGDVLDVLRHGLTLDLSTALYVLLLPYLLCVVSIWRSGRGWLCALRTYFLLIAIVLAVAFVADTSLYPYWGFKLDASCLQYLSTPGQAAASVSPRYLLWRLLVVIVLASLLFLLFTWRLRPLPPLRRKRGFGLCCLLLLPLLLVGMRGGVEESTTNIGQVYYSQNPFLNHSAVNPVFSFLASFERTARADLRYHFVGDDECRQLTDSLYDTRSLCPDTLLRTRRPDVVLVMLESCSGQFTMIGGRDDITPNLNRLASEGIYFSQCYANSWRTDRATVCLWGGYPSFPTMSLMKDPSTTRHLPSIARSLARAGYHTSYYYGGDINFAKKRAYLVNAGFSRLSSAADYSAAQQHTAKWGVRDDIVFSRIADDIARWAPTDTMPHLIGCNTLSSHEPWDVPTRVLDDPVENAFHYLDQCVARFIGRLRRLPAWDNLLVILIPDHGVNYKGIDENSVLKMHVPMLWLGGAVRQPRRVDVVCNQSDLAATLLGQLGLPHDDFRFSRDVVSQNYRHPFAMHTFNNGFSLVEGHRFQVFDLTSDRPVVGHYPDLIHLGKTLLQAATDDLGQQRSTQPAGKAL